MGALVGSALEIEGGSEPVMDALGDACGRASDADTARRVFAADDALGGYTMATLVADRILRTAEEEVGEHTRRFTIAESVQATADLLIVLLSPYVTLATNYPVPASSVAETVATPALLPVRADEEQGGVADALKVLYTADPATIDAASGHGQVGHATAAHSLVLPEGEARASVLSALRASTEMLPPTARRVGALHVGYLPVAATWD